MVETQGVLLFVCFFELASEPKPMPSKCTLKREVSSDAGLEAKELLEE